ncbi:MAG: DUF134 domain-containing protein [Candidatus Omnitrophota bacterium]
MSNRGRPLIKKIIQQQPRIDSFSPHGGYSHTGEIKLTIEEYEAIRLADHMSLAQKDAAKMMGISQQSFSRIVRASRKKISDALVNGKFLHIHGGSFLNKRSMEIMKKLSRKPVPAPDAAERAFSQSQ